MDEADGDRCRRLAGLAAFGRDEGAKHTYYGLPGHLRGLLAWGGRCWPPGPSQPA